MGQTSEAPGSPFHIVGIGASAGGLEALQTLFSSMPLDTGAAFIVLQHLSPDFESRMDELLARRTGLRVLQVSEGVRVEPNSVYLIPPGKEMIISGGCLHLTDQERTAGVSLPIDLFMRSLAQDVGRYSIGVVLSGTGSDGSRGVVEISKAGGLVIIQEPSTARFDGMPNSALRTGVSDLELAPELIPNALESYIKSGLSGDELARDQASGASTDSPDLSPVIRQLRRRYGIDFSHYKPSTLNRRVYRRVEMLAGADIASYSQFLENHPAELESLYRDLLIGVTQFFRDSRAFAALDRMALQELIETSSSEGRELRAWCAGCATGEEAFSLAIAMAEVAREQKIEPHFRIFATDVHKRSLEVASQGAYPEEALKELLPEHRERYFLPEGEL